MKCPKCDKEIANDSQFCEFCGTKINLVPAGEKKPKNYKPLWILMIVIIFMSVLGIGSLYVYDLNRKHLREVAAAKAAQEEAERRALEAFRLVEEAREKAIEDSIVKQIEENKRIRFEKIKAAKKAGYVDLGLPSGTLWKKSPEGIYDGTYDAAMKKYGRDRIPSHEQWQELIDNCKWEWYEYEKKTESIGLDGTRYFGWSMCQGYKVYGKNGNYIDLEAQHYGAGGIWARYFSSSSTRNSIWCTLIHSEGVKCYEYGNFYNDEAEYFYDYESWRRFYIHLVRQL